MKIREYNNTHMATHVNWWIGHGDFYNINHWYRRKLIPKELRQAYDESMRI